jgi:transposase
MDLIDQPVDADVGEEEILDRVAAIDVAKDCGVVCVRVPHQTRSGRRDTSGCSVPARTNSIIALGQPAG